MGRWLTTLPSTCLPELLPSVVDHSNTDISLSLDAAKRHCVSKKVHELAGHVQHLNTPVNTLVASGMTVAAALAAMLAPLTQLRKLELCRCEVAEIPSSLAALHSLTVCYYPEDDDEAFEPGLLQELSQWTRLLKTERDSSHVTQFKESLWKLPSVRV